MAEFEDACKALIIPLIVLPPKRPTYNGGVDRGNRIFREEFYSRNNIQADSLGALRVKLDKAVNKDNEYRSHAGLKGLAPMEYISTVQLEAGQSHMM